MKSILLLSFLFCTLFAGAQGNTTIKRSAFSLEHPSTWTIDTSDSDYDPDALFTLEAPDNVSMIMFIIMDISIDKDLLLDAQVKEFKSNLIKKPTSETPFSKWGVLNGKGMTIKGKLMGVFPGAIRIFTWNNSERSMVIVQQYYDEDFDNVKKDFSIIESSFKFSED